MLHERGKCGTQYLALAHSACALSSAETCDIEYSIGMWQEIHECEDGQIERYMCHCISSEACVPFHRTLLVKLKYCLLTPIGEM